MNTNAERITAEDPPRQHLSIEQGKILGNEKSLRPPMREEAIAARLASMHDAGMKTLAMANQIPGLTVNALERWIGGQREKEVTKKLSDWIADMDAEIAAREGSFVQTPSTALMVQAIEQARAPQGPEGRRGVALIYGFSGTGKSAMAEWLERLDENVIRVLASGEQRTYVQLLRAVVEKITGYGGHAAVGENLDKCIARKLPAGSALIFDHAHLIPLGVMEELLAFPDEYGIALVFIGNTGGYNKLMNAKMAQITSRVAGAYINVGLPSEEDVDALLEAWGVAGRQERKCCVDIGRQDGGLRYLSNTVREARKISRACGLQKIDVRMLKLGAVNAGAPGFAK
jgi:DNA transposition AAA+ family ATPase